MSLTTSPSESEFQNQNTIADAAIANSEEHQVTLRQAVKTYPGAIFFTCLLMISVTVDGYGQSCSCANVIIGASSTVEPRELQWDIVWTRS